MHQESLFFESFTDALADVARCLGGYKRAGAIVMDSRRQQTALIKWRDRHPSRAAPESPLQSWRPEPVPGRR